MNVDEFYHASFLAVSILVSLSHEHVVSGHGPRRTNDDVFMSRPRAVFPCHALSNQIGSSGDARIRMVCPATASEWLMWRVDAWVLLLCWHVEGEFMRAAESFSSHIIGGDVSIWPFYAANFPRTWRTPSNLRSCKSFILKPPALIVLGKSAVEMPRTAAACALIAWLLLAHPCKLPHYAWMQPGSSIIYLRNLFATCAQGCRRRRPRSERTSVGCWTAAATATASGPRGAGGRARRTASPTAAASTGSPTWCPSASACARGAPPPPKERPATPRSDPSWNSS
jgi:hypothetical protein